MRFSLLRARDFASRKEMELREYFVYYLCFIPHRWSKKSA